MSDQEIPMSTVTSRDRSAAWDEPEGLHPRGTVVILPGRGERPAIYQRFGRRLAADAWRVRVVGDATVDLEGVTAQVKTALTAPDDPAPRVLVGSDTGALAALRLLATGSVTVDGAVLAGLPDPDGDPDLGSWDAEVVARTSCPTHQSLIVDQDRLERGALTAERVPQALREAVHLPAITVPVLGLHGADDSISALSYARQRYARLPRARLVSVADGRHDVLNARSHRSVAATVVLFLEDLRAGTAATTVEELEEGEGT
jgi:alpha-beta hydrolase superfamily lysophospholipase